MIFHSDRGSEYASREFRRACCKLGVTQSMGRVGSCFDNAVSEAFNSVLKAKHTTVAGKVGSSVMYQVKGTAGPAHGADTAVVVTNGSFTRDATTWGEGHQVHWVDRDRLRRWAEHGTPLQDLLRLPTARKTPLRRAA